MQPWTEKAMYNTLAWIKKSSFHPPRWPTGVISAVVQQITVMFVDYVDCPIFFCHVAIEHLLHL